MAARERVIDFGVSWVFGYPPCMAFLARVGSLLAAIGALSCSGKVVLEDGAGGAGTSTSSGAAVTSGKGAATTTVTAVASSSTGAGSHCTKGACVGDGDSCDCPGTCGANQVEARCKLLPSPQCDCLINGQVVSSCTQASGNACDLELGCCALVFDPVP